MSKMCPPFSTTILSILALFTSTTAAQAYTSLTTFADWQAARTCVQNCVTDEVAIFGYMTLGCHQSNPATCLCGNAQSESTLMHNDIYSCAIRSCSNTAEALSAAGIFDEWCGFNLNSISLVNGPSITPTITGAGSSSTASSTSTPSLPRSTSSTSPTSSSSSGSASSSSGTANNGSALNTGAGNHGLSRAGKIAIGVTIPVVILAVLGIGWFLVLRRQHKKPSTVATEGLVGPRTHLSNEGTAEDKGPTELGGKKASYQRSTATDGGEDFKNKVAAAQHLGTTQIEGNPRYEVSTPAIHELSENSPVHELHGA